MSDKWVRTETGAMQRVAKPVPKKKKKKRGFIGDIADFYKNYKKGEKNLLDGLDTKVAKPKGK